MTVQSFSQTIDTSTIDGLYQYIFAKLDKTQIPTGYLQEYGAPLTSMLPYNGTLSTGNTINIDLWHTLYWQMNTAYTGITGGNAFVSTDSANSSILKYESDTLATPIVILFGNYNSVKSNAFTSNLLKVVNDQVLDVAGRTSSPYQSNTFFAACPVIPETQTGVAIFIFQQSLFFKNQSVGVSSFYVDFADGRGYIATPWNQRISCNYTDTGMKQIKIKMLLNTGAYYECYTNYHVSTAFTFSYTSYYDYSQFFSPTATNNGGTAYVQLGSNHTTLTQPLIVVEGYDVYSAAPDFETTPYEYSDFINAINAPTQHMILMIILMMLVTI